MLVVIKLVHTCVWIVMAASVFYSLYAGFIGRFDTWFWLAAGLIGAEVAVLIANGWKCPLTNVAERCTDDRGDAFDIYLPRWLARHNVKIFTVILVVGAIACTVRRLVFG